MGGVSPQAVSSGRIALTAFLPSIAQLTRVESPASCVWQRMRPRLSGVLTQAAAALTGISAEGAANVTQQREISDPKTEDPGLGKAGSRD